MNEAYLAALQCQDYPLHAKDYKEEASWSCRDMFTVGGGEGRSQIVDFVVRLAAESRQEKAGVIAERRTC